MKIVFLLTVFWIQTYKVTGAIPNCCISKNVGGLEYTLLRVEDTSQYNCLTNCVYEKIGEPGIAYCFGTGDLKVECTGEASATNGTDNSETSIGGRYCNGQAFLANVMTQTTDTYAVYCCTDKGTVASSHTCNDCDFQSMCSITQNEFCVELVDMKQENYCSGSNSDAPFKVAVHFGQTTQTTTHGNTTLPTTTHFGKNKICGDDLVTHLDSLTVSNNNSTIHCCDNGTTIAKTTCGNGQNCSSVCGPIILTPNTCGKLVKDPKEGEDHCSSSDLAPSPYQLAILEEGNTVQTCTWQSFCKTATMYTDYCGLFTLVCCNCQVKNVCNCNPTP